MSNEVEIAKQWIMKAKNDLLNAENNLKSEEIPYDTVCFHYQQAAEKMLKAFLIANNQEFPFTHDLLLLLEKIIPINNEAEELREQLSILIPYAVEVRCPDDGFIPTGDDAREAKESSDKILEWIKKAKPVLFKKI